MVVPFDDNTRLLKERYKAGGGSITAKLVAGEGHKVSPSFFESQELIEFVIANLRKSGAAFWSASPTIAG